MSVVGVAGGTAVADLELATGGRTNYAIVVARDASPSERHGAQELARFLKEMSGADFPVLQEGGRVPEKAILVGRGRTVESLIGPDEFRGLGDDGFLIRACGQRLILAGGRQRGSMYACYSLLEDVLGCRWYTSTVSVIPKIIPRSNADISGL